MEWLARKEKGRQRELQEQAERDAITDERAAINKAMIEAYHNEQAERTEYAAKWHAIQLNANNDFDDIENWCKYDIQGDYKVFQFRPPEFLMFGTFGYAILSEMKPIAYFEKKIDAAVAKLHWS